MSHSIKIKIPTKTESEKITEIKTVGLTETQSKWIESKNINLSKLVRDLIDQLIGGENGK